MSSCDLNLQSTNIFITMNRRLHLVLLALGCATMMLFARTPQNDFTGIILLTSISFCLALMAWNSRKEFRTRHILIAAALLRLSVSLSPPLLSDDYFRFQWDGKLVSEGVSPFAYTPAQLAKSQSLTQPQEEWLATMNSSDYFSVYPPTCQYLWALPHFFSSENEIWLLFIRALFLLAELGTVFILIKLLTQFNRPGFYSILYAFNPLVILDTTGNLHPEGWMVFFAALSVWLWVTLRPTLSAVAFGIAVATKLLPLLAIPFILRRLGWRTTIRFSLISGAVVILLFLPILSHAELQHIGSSLNLYFRHFEFNASIYSIARELGMHISGYNRIAVIGPLLGAIATTVILFLAWRSDRKGFFISLQWGWLIYLLLATTVHPWYIVPLVALSAVTGQWWAVIWSFTIFFSYAFYSDSAVPVVWIAMEYLLLAVFLFIRGKLGRKSEEVMA